MRIPNLEPSSSFLLTRIWISNLIMICVKSGAIHSSTSAPLSSPEIPDLFLVSDTMAASSPGAEVRKGNGGDSNKNMLVVIVVVSSAITAAVVVLLFCWIFHKRISVMLHKNDPMRSDAEKVTGSDSSRCKLHSISVSGTRGSISLMDYKQLETATNGFDGINLLGEGGFGRVYKGQISENFYVAVKKVDDCSEAAEREFKNEVELLKKIQHPNVISLLGYCIRDGTRLLIYELMTNGSLETQLHGPSHGSALSWHVRMKIALGIARGLEHLHEDCTPRVIHRDIKSSNILLDSNYSAKLSDFGLAVIDGPQNRELVSMSGTLGYVAPEYLLDGKLTEKSDVYAFGVVLLELILGKKPVERLGPSECQSIVTWAMPQLKDRSKLPNIVDPVIKDEMDLKHLYQVAAVAVLCVQPEPSYRPLITDVLHSLIPLVPVELGGTLRVTQSNIRK